MRLRVTAGDVFVMPAGVSHEDVGHSDDNIMCGGYPGGRDWDNIQPEFLSQALYLQARKRIMALPIPAHSCPSLANPPVAAQVQKSVDSSQHRPAFTPKKVLRAAKVHEMLM